METPVSREQVARTAPRIEQWLDELRVRYDVPGLSYALFTPDELVHADGMGARNVQSREPATAETLYSIASVTKQFTALAVLQLVDADSVALDDEIREYVDFWADVPGQPITIRELLSHSSGMPADYAGTRELLFSGSQPTSPIVTRDDELRHANGAADRRITDSDRYMYSNRGYQILGELVESASGRTHADHVEEEIFEPLEMTRSQVGYGEIAETDPDAITEYAIEDGEPVPTEHDLEAAIRPPYAAGGILSSVTDLAVWGRCLLSGGERDGERIVSENLVREMCSPQAPMRDTIGSAEKGYGYGVHVRELLGDRVCDHTGTAPGVSRAYVGLARQRRIGVTLAVNTASVPIGAVGRGVLALLAGESPEDAVPFYSMQSKLDAVTGTYEGYRSGLTVSVTKSGWSGPYGSHLRVTYEGGPGWDFPAFPETASRGDYRFYAVSADGGREPVTFHETDGGMEFRCNVDRLERVSSTLTETGESTDADSTE